MPDESPSQNPPLNIALLAAGAGGMFCGSCLRDSALASALMRAGHRVALVPMYTPLKTEDGNIAIDQVFYGGINVYLQHVSRLFRRAPRALGWLLDRPGLLKIAGNFGAQTSPAKLGPLTISILKGEDGPAVKELRRLIDFLKSEVRPQIISLPNLMFVGLAPMLRDELQVPVVCELTGEDLFLGQLAEPHRTHVQSLIRERAQDVSGFIATSSYYANEMANYLQVDRQRITVVHPSVPADFVSDDELPRKHASPTVGYFARVCPEKGFADLIDAMELLRKFPGMADAKLIAGGYLGAANQKWFELTMRRAQSLGEGAVQYRGELDRAAKIALLDSIDVFSVPSIYAETKGIYVLEALARGVPVVQPAHGSFPELVELTGGGILTPPGDAPALAAALASLLGDAPRRANHGNAGRNAIRDHFTDDHMATKMIAFYRAVMQTPLQSADQNAYHPAGT